MLLPRQRTALSIPLLALPLSCTGDDPKNEGEGGTEGGDGDGDGGPCTEPGTTVPDFEPFVPEASVPAPKCSTGWGSDAPLRDAEWVTTMAVEQSYYYSIPVIAKALSDGAALLITEQSLQWFDGQGTAVAQVAHGFPQGFNTQVRPNAVVVREADEHVFIAGGDNNDLVIREFADGELVGEVTVPTPGQGSRAVGLFEFSTDEWLIVGEEYDPVEYQGEAFFMRVDASGGELLRKARSLGYSYYYSSSLTLAALDDDDNLLFGSTTVQFVVDPSNGAVIVPSVGLTGVRDLVGSLGGPGFAFLTQQNNGSIDGAASLIDGFGTNQWTQVYDRALTGEQFFDIAARPGGGFVAGGIDGIWWEPMQLQFNGQPMIIAFDGQGTAEWIGRLAIPGDVRSVDVGSDGTIVAAGNSRTGGTDYNGVDAYIWLASW